MTGKSKFTRDIEAGKTISNPTHSKRARWPYVSSPPCTSALLTVEEALEREKAEKERSEARLDPRQENLDL